MHESTVIKLRLLLKFPLPSSAPSLPAAMWTSTDSYVLHPLMMMMSLLSDGFTRQGCVDFRSFTDRGLRAPFPIAAISCKTLLEVLAAGAVQDRQLSLDTCIGTSPSCHI